jgi:thiol-disulfide isomerase/thioredoxin
VRQTTPAPVSAGPAYPTQSTAAMQIRTVDRKANSNEIFMIRYLTGLLMIVSLSCSAAGQLEPYRGFAQTPALSLEDLGHKTHALPDYRGRVVLVNFWASWCGPCVMEMPSLQRLQDAMAGKPFTLLAVNVEESSGTVWKFAAKVKIQFPLLLDREGQTAYDWGIDLYPTSFLVDPQGRVQYVAYGPRNWDDPEMIQAIKAMF